MPPYGGGIIISVAVMLLTFILIIISIPLPPHSFIPGLKLTFSANPSHRSLPFFRTDSTDSLDCSPIPLSMPVFKKFLYFFVYHFLVVGTVRDSRQLLSAR